MAERILKLSLAVLALAVIAASARMFCFPRYSTNSYADVTQTQLGMVAAYLKIYRLDTGVYPSTEQGLDALVDCPEGASGWRGPYLEYDSPQDPWWNPYQYQLEGEAFRIWSWGPDGINGTVDDIVHRKATPFAAEPWLNWYELMQFLHAAVAAIVFAYGLTVLVSGPLPRIKYNVKNPAQSRLNVFRG